jgi:hypothetical protein
VFFWRQNNIRKHDFGDRKNCLTHSKALANGAENGTGVPFTQGGGICQLKKAMATRLQATQGCTL